MAAATTRRRDRRPALPAMVRYVAYATADATIAMLKQFAPSVVTPPSPKKSAWIASARERARIDPEGPRTITAIVTPRACPVVPPGSGRLNIITTKENAANTETRETARVLNVALRRRKAPYQPTPAPA